MQAPSAFLVARVLHERQAVRGAALTQVTCRLLSRACGIALDDARTYVLTRSHSTMHDWMTRQDDASVYATYVVRGQRKDADTGATVETIELVGSDALDNARAQYTAPECLLYAVQAHKSYDAPLLASVNRETLHDAEMLARVQADTSRLGAITNAHTPSGDLPAAAPRRPPPAKDTKPAKPPADDTKPAAPPADDAKRAAAPARVDTKREGEPHPSKPGRKRRLVVRKIKTKNEKGYTVTRDVEEYESYSEDDAEDAPATSAPAAPSAQAPPSAPSAPAKRPPPAKPKPKSAQQASLTSFFTKR